MFVFLYATFLYYIRNMVELKNMNELKNNIWKFYIIKICSALFFSVPIIVLFWQENGLNLTQIMVLQSLYALMIVLLEIPTGYFADIFKRKNSLMLGGMFLAIGVFMYGLGTNFVQFLIAEVFFAFAIAFTSGADSAFLYDTLKDYKQEKLYKKIWGNSYFYALIAISVASILGGFIGKINFRYTFFATIPFAIAVAFISISLKEPKKHKMIFEKGYVFKLFQIIKQALVKNIKLEWLIIYSAVIYTLFQAALWLYQPYFKLSGLDIMYFGFVFAAFNLVAAISAKYAHKIEEKIGKKYSLFSLLFLVGIAYLLMSNFIYLFSFCFAFLHQFVRSFSRIVFSDYINKLTTSDVRATVLSIQSMIGKLGYALLIPFIGWIADVYSLIQAFVVLGITSVIIGIIMVLILIRVRVVE